MFNKSKLCLLTGALLVSICSPAYADTQYSMDPGWKFIKQDVTGAETLGFADSNWTTVSTPHTYNDTDSFSKLINHSSGDVGTYTGPAWYRKHFKIPSQYSGSKIIVEFERIRQGARFYINGVQVGVYDNGVTACGIDITGNVNFGATDNVLAVRVDNSSSYLESSTGVGFEWNGKAFNPNYGGLIGHVWLHLTGAVYQTFPLYNNLQTTGIYVYPSNFSNVSPSQGNLTVNVESQVRNESGVSQSVTLTALVVDPTNGSTLASFSSAATALASNGTAVLKTSGALTNAKLWSDVTPNLYQVITNIIIGGTVVDSRTTVTGFRQTAFKGGVGTGGVYINGRFVYLLGFAQRSSNEWASLGEAVPDWMHDYHANLIKGSNSNYIRWMHITPQRIDVAANDKAGIINIAPAGDKEGDVTGVQWTQRTNVMRASMVYLRNNPSLLFWEAGNNGITAAHMQEMYNLKQTWDPKGGRAIGCRDLADAGGAPYSEYFGTMVAYSSTWTPSSDASYFRGYSNNYRNQAPIIECEDERDEGARRFWDKYSPPHFGFTPGPNDTYHWDSESFIVGDSTGPAAIARLNIWLNLFSIRNTTSAKSRYAAYASIYFSDSDADGRQDSSEVCRVSGKVDAVRIPKQIYYAHRVVGNTQPDIHIIGHWTYPAGTTKTMYVIANTPTVELFVNGVSKGRSSSPADHYTFSFPYIAWAAGTIKAVGYNSSGTQVCSHQLQTVGTPVALKLTPAVGPDGLKADGADVAWFEVEAVDANGMRCPTDEAQVNFTMSGPAVWRGGYNSGVVGSTNVMHLLTEAGVNRVFVRSTLTPGTITVTASRSGLTSATASVTSSALPVTDGLVLVTTSAAEPPAPTGLAANVASGQVALSWSASPGATSYNVQRATVSGGPYALIATGVTATRFTNTGLINGTTYYYVVSAVNTVGEGPDSTQVSATPATTTATVYQSENGTWDSAGVLETTNAGWTGIGYVNTGNAVGGFSEVTVFVPASGTYTLDFRYANGGALNRPADLSINKVVVQSAVAFASTGAWTTWSDVIVSQPLNAGNNTIRLTATTANGCANLDKVTVQ